MFKLEETDKLLTTTRAVRRRLDFDRPVEREVLLDCVRISQQAPTGSNSQKWRWVILTDAQKKLAIAEVYRRGCAILDTVQADTPAEEQQTHRVYDSARFLALNLHRAPVIVIPCIEDRPANFNDHCVTATTYGSILPAVWSFQLALRSRGLGSAWTTLHLIWEQEVAGLLDIPNDVMQVALLPVAYTVGQEFKLADRPDPESIVHWNCW
ncbi:MAG: nitroreductase family protein [Halioglobus sp.]|nr:nitroreductase family protein [Halioglobus sp.]